MDDTLDVEQLAALLRKSPRTIKKDLSIAPERLPPRLRIPGSRKVLWLRSTTMDWLKKCEEVQV